MAAVGQGEGLHGVGASRGGVGSSAPRRHPSPPPPAFPALSADACASFPPAARTRRAHGPRKTGAAVLNLRIRRLQAAGWGNTSHPRQATARLLGSRAPALGKWAPGNLMLGAVSVHPHGGSRVTSCITDPRVGRGCRGLGQVSPQPQVIREPQREQGSKRPM